MSPTSPELRWLAFDTSTDVLSLAVARDGQVWTQTLPGGAQASSGLIPAVLAMLAAGLSRVLCQLVITDQAVHITV